MTLRDPTIRLTVNGETHALRLPGATPLLAVLRNDLGLNGPKFGCGIGECGSCTVLVDGVAARACVLHIADVDGRDIRTLEGLGTPEALHPVQAAFVETAGAQCGYCLNGMIMTTAALLDANPDPSEEQIREALRFNLCRCGTHVEILAAVRLAAERLAAQRLAAGRSAAQRPAAPGRRR
ncbi:MAG: (2Fe-2S)-binding protein [Rhodoplanes sp.]|uniref:(2Fe-2S)-binding protein n=1 Tax=Rhodoplanes sp. TaxID=1968906 RepID=UPI0017DA4DAF|nr:(2Fe-2S)-binding protein [Rhodoplanes sp.]NVO13131.1 (2Fe-2S)-binding protein [Rhodoplanes sp.]